MNKHIAAFLIALTLVAIGLATHPEKIAAREQPVITITTLQSGVTSGQSTALGVGTMPNCRETAIYIVWGAGTNAGGITVESSYDGAYAGTWAPLTVVAWSAASKQDIVQITGIHGALRTRVSTSVTGGTVSTYAVCN